MGYVAFLASAPFLGGEDGRALATTVLTPAGFVGALFLSVFGYLFGLAPAAITGLIAAFFLRRLPTLAYVLACVAAGLLTCSPIFIFLANGGRPVGTGEVLLYMPFASVVSALTCALLTLRRETPRN